MLPASDLLYGSQLASSGVLALPALTLIACAAARSYVQRRDAAAEFGWSNCVLVAGVVLVGAVLSELVTRTAAETAAPGSPNLWVARGLLVGGPALAGIAWILQSARLALLRAELRRRTNFERELQHAKTAADEANRAKSDFLAVMSHEIRTPLNAVMGFTNLLAETRLDEVQRGYLATINSEGSRLGLLINDILDLSKIEEGRLVLERLPFSPAETAHDVLRLLGARAIEKKLDMRLEAQLAGPLLVAGDPLRFRQVLINLVDNAVKFTPRGSVTVFLSWTPPEAESSAVGRLHMSVRDTGIGIAEEKLKDLFQMFMQADTSTTRRFGGTGLGLAICQRLVALMGGEIRVSSRRGEGSEFAFTLPIAQVGVPSATSPVEAEPATEPRPPARVLVVDDMETNRFLLEVFLRRNGFIPELASGGEEAVRMATTRTYDVILMDLQMPDVDGYTATQRIRAAEPAGRHTLIIALTASVAKGTREKCLAAGMDEHMTKPLDLKKFKTLLNTLLRPVD